MAIWALTVYQRHTNPNVEIRNVWHVGDLDATIADANIAANWLWEWYAEYFSDMLPVTWEAYNMSIRNMSVAGMPEIMAPQGSPIEGVIGYTVGATQTAAIINMQSMTVRPNRARKFIGPLAEQSITNSALTETMTDILDAWVTSFDTWQGDHADDGQGFVTARYDPAEGRVTSANLLSVAGYSLIPGSLRSRKAGVGI